MLYLGSTRRVQQYHSSSVHPQPLDGHILKDPYFLVRLRLFSEVCHEIMYRFQTMFTCANDGGFFVYRQIARLIYSVGSRCLSVGSMPEPSDWEALTKLDIAKCTKIPSAEFGVGSDFRRELSIVKAAQTSDFLIEARDFYCDFLANFLTSTRHIIVFSKGLAAFDPGLLFREDLDLAYECFSCLYGTFQQRGWLKASERPSALSEYNCFVRELRSSYVDASGSSLPIVDVVSVFPSLPCLVSKPLLSRIFRLTCLCLPLKGLVPEVPSLGLNALDLSPEAGRNLIQPLYSFIRQADPTFMFDFSEDAH